MRKDGPAQHRRLGCPNHGYKLQYIKIKYQTKIAPRLRLQPEGKIFVGYRRGGAISRLSASSHRRFCNGR